MQLDWTTFFLEILNFLILVWLLSRFFYRPVMDIIARRREDIRKGMDEARQTRMEADTLKQKYETRVQEWEQEKSAARTELHESIEQERRQLLQRLQEELEAERQKQEVINRRREENERLKNEQQALDQGTAFCARLLARLANRDLEATIANLLLEDLAALSPEQRQVLVSAYIAQAGAVTVYSAFPPADTWRGRLEQALRDLLGAEATCQYHQDQALVAGLRIAIGSRLLQANLQDELKYFTEGIHDGH